MRIAIQTHGCRLNQAEGDALEQRLRRDGHELVADVGQAEVYLLNSCTITHGADSDARQAVRRARRKNPDLRVWLTGCYANSAPEEAAKLPGVERVIGNLEKDSIPLLPELSSSSEMPLNSTASGLISVENLRPRKTPRPATWTTPAAATNQRARAYLKIQDGCNYACTFCIVPQVRGRSRSLSVQQVQQQFEALVAAEHPELGLTGVHLGTYGWDFGQRDGLVRLMATLLPLAKESGTRLRMGSLDPHEVHEPMLKLMADFQPNFCRHLHLPIQSGSDAVLRRMRRAHRAGDLEKTVPLARKYSPEVCVGSDIIVGFPGETENDFEETLELAQRLELAYAHVFSYSVRDGTKAAEMPGQIDESVKKQRSARLREQLERQRLHYTSRFLDRELPAIFLRRRHSKTGRLFALTDNYLRIEVKGGDELKGRSGAVRLKQVAAGQLVGEVC